jgi:hypothetical protein
MAYSAERGQPPVTSHPGRHRPAEQGVPIPAAVPGASVLTTA